MNKIEITLEELYHLVTVNVDYGRIMNPNLPVSDVFNRAGFPTRTVENSFGGYEVIDLKKVKERIDSKKVLENEKEINKQA